MLRLLLGLVFAGLFTWSAVACIGIPALGSAIESAPEARLSESDTRKLTELRSEMTRLAAADKVEEARKVEESAMQLQGSR